MTSCFAMSNEQCKAHIHLSMRGTLLEFQRLPRVVGSILDLFEICFFVVVPTSPREASAEHVDI